MLKFDIRSEMVKFFSTKKDVDTDKLVGEYDHYLSPKGYEEDKKFIGTIDPNLNIYKIVNVSDMNIKVDDMSFSLSDVFTFTYEKALDINKGTDTDHYITITPNGKEPMLFHYRGLLILILLIMLARSSNFRNLDPEVLVKSTTFSYFNKYDDVTRSICVILDECMALARALQDQNLFTSDVIRSFSHYVCKGEDNEQLDLTKPMKDKK